MKITEESKFVSSTGQTYQSWVVEVDDGHDLRINFPGSHLVVRGEGPHYTFKVDAKDNKRICFTIVESLDTHPREELC